MPLTQLGQQSRCRAAHLEISLEEKPDKKKGITDYEAGFSSRMKERGYESSRRRSPHRSASISLIIFTAKAELV